MICLQFDKNGKSVDFVSSMDYNTNEQTCLQGLSKAQCFIVRAFIFAKTRNNKDAKFFYIKQ